MNEKNLIPVNQRSPAEQRRISSKGGKARARAIRRKKDAREAIRLLLEMPVSGKIKEAMLKQGYDEDATNLDALVVRMFTTAAAGNVNAFRVLLEYGGLVPGI